MKTETIEVPGLPEGWKAVSYRVGRAGVEHTLDDSMRPMLCHECMTYPVLIVEKIQSSRIVLEETEEVRQAKHGEWIEVENGMIGQWEGPDLSSRQYKIWKQVKETDIPLTNSESKLSLSVDECRNVRSLIKDFENLGWFVNPARSLLLQKITEFIKDK